MLARGMYEVFTKVLWEFYEVWELFKLLRLLYQTCPKP